MGHFDAVELETKSGSGKDSTLIVFSEVKSWTCSLPDHTHTHTHTYRETTHTHNHTHTHTHTETPTTTPTTPTHRHTHTHTQSLTSEATVLSLHSARKGDFTHLNHPASLKIKFVGHFTEALGIIQFIGPAVSRLHTVCVCVYACVRECVCVFPIAIGSSV